MDGWMRDRWISGEIEGEWIGRLVGGGVNTGRHMTSQCTHEAVSLLSDAGYSLLVHVPISWTWLNNRYSRNLL